VFNVSSIVREQTPLPENWSGNTRWSLCVGLTCEPKSELFGTPRKEVIQPQVPLRLPCYDFTPVTDHSLVSSFPCGLGYLLLEQPTPMV
jgi:hypothetical protein